MYSARNTNNGSSLKIVQVLIDKGADLNSRDNDRWTVLMYAIHCSEIYSSLETVKTLIKAGANFSREDYEMIQKYRPINIKTKKYVLNYLNVNMINPSDKGVIVIKYEGLNSSSVQKRIEKMLKEIRDICGDGDGEIVIAHANCKN